MGEVKKQVSKTRTRKTRNSASILSLEARPASPPSRVAGARSRRSSESSSKRSLRSFAEGLCFQKLFFIFLFGSVFGTIYEDLLIYVQSGEWMIHRGVIYGPFNVIYGFGAAVMCWVLLRKKYNNWEVFGISAVLGGAVEYLLSLGQEVVTGTTSWDYSDQILNLGGRTSVPIMIVWGLMGILLVKVIYPVISNLVERIPRNVGEPIFWVLLVFMILNCLVSWTAIIRQNLRHHGMAPWTPIGEIYDEYYNDEFLERYFPNMVRSESVEVRRWGGER